MSELGPFVPLAHSERRHALEVRPGGEVPDLEKSARVTIVVRSRSSPETTSAAVREIASQLPYERSALPREEWERLYGAAPADVELVQRFAREHDLDIVETSAARRCVVLSGTLAAFSRVFRVPFVQREHPHYGLYRSYEGQIHIPAELQGVVEHVMGLDDQCVADRHLVPEQTRGQAGVDPRQVTELYQFPADINGDGQCVGIIELGGGFHPSDLRTYFARRGLLEPRITGLEIEGEKNNPAPPAAIKAFLKASGAEDAGRAPAGAPHAAPPSAPTLSPAEVNQIKWTIEATMDVELVGTVANGAHIVVYFAPNSEQGKYHAFTTALADTVNSPSVISCSWGAYEDQLHPTFVTVMDRVFQDATMQGVTLCCSTGDFGDGSVRNGKPSAEFPASSPHVLACGGTHLELDTSGALIHEVVWNEQVGSVAVQSGGGFSRFFERPHWQTEVHPSDPTEGSGRGVPDVAGKADLAAGYKLFVGEAEVPHGGGTSAVAPLWAGLVALINQKLGTCAGYITPLLYRQGFRGATRDITEGYTSEHFRARKGWDPCTGWGSPLGRALLSALSEVAHQVSHP